MTFWLVIGALSLVTILLVLWPFIRRRRKEADGTRETLLAALEKAEADQSDDAMRNEIARRLIAHDREHKKAGKRSGTKLGWALAILAVVFIPFGAFGIYAFQGAYGLIEIQADDALLKENIRQVEARLAATPTDWRGWGVIAPVYRSRGQFDKASEALANAIKYKTDISDDERARWQADRVELMYMKGQGSFPQDVAPWLADALKADPNNAKALYFDALYAEQYYAAEDAIAKWEQIVEFGRENGQTGMMQEAERRIARLEMVENQGSVAPDQNSAIMGMVSQLETRLSEDGGSADEWMRLVNAFGVLKNRSKFAEAVKNARVALDGEVTSLDALGRMEREILQRDFGE